MGQSLTWREWLETAIAARSGDRSRIRGAGASMQVARGLKPIATGRLDGRDLRAPGGSELVRVDFVVTDKADHPVKGLSAKDFVVKEDGKRRPIVAFEAFAGDEAPVASTPGGSAALPSPATSTVGASMVLLVDDQQMSLSQATQVKPGIKALLERVGESHQRLMLFAPGSRVSVVDQAGKSAAGLTEAVDQTL